MDSAQSIESPEMIREQIEETRASLAVKLESLESEVRSSVDGASETVKHSVEEMKKVFLPSHWVEKRPFVAIGASVAAGVALAAWTSQKRAAAGQQLNRAVTRSGAVLGDDSSISTRSATAGVDDVRPQSEPNRKSLMSKLGPELDSLKQIAISAALGFAADYAKRSVPDNARSEVGRIIDGMVKKYETFRG